MRETLARVGGPKNFVSDPKSSSRVPACGAFCCFLGPPTVVGYGETGLGGMGFSDSRLDWLRFLLIRVKKHGGGLSPPAEFLKNCLTKSERQKTD